jgi:hypothetical protein
VHVSAYSNKKKELIDAGDYEKGKHQHPELRKPQDLSVRKPSKKQDLSVRKKHKKQDLSVRKNADHYAWTDTGNRRQSDTEIQKDFQQRFEMFGGVGIVSPEKASDTAMQDQNHFFRQEHRVGWD